MNPVGTIGWIDLTVADATSLRDFYAAVAGRTPADVPMGDYAGYCMHPPGDAKPVAGICHARVLREPRSMGSYGRLAVICDPAGAVAALLEPPND